MFVLVEAQCCRVWVVVEGFTVRDCGCCGRRPVVLPMIRVGSLRV